MSRSLALMLCAPAVMLMACSMESKPDEAFLDSSMILRPGVNDFGSSVRKYVDFLETRAQHDGSLVQVTGWKRTNAGYALNLKLKVPVKLEFIWSEQEKLSLLQYADMGGQRLPGMDFFMLSMSAPVHPSKVAKAQELQSQASPSTSAPPATPASTAGTAAQEAPSASQAEMDAESEGVPSDSVPTAAQAPTPQVKPQTRTAAATGQVPAGSAREGQGRISTRLAPSGRPRDVKRRAAFFCARRRLQRHRRRPAWAAAAIHHARAPGSLSPDSAGHCKHTPCTRSSVCKSSDVSTSVV